MSTQLQATPNAITEQNMLAKQRRRAERRRPGGVRELLLLAFPVILTQMSNTTMGVVDTAFVGHLGARELAAVGFGGIWLWTLICGVIGTTVGVQTFVSQHHGRGEPEKCSAWAWQGLYTLVPLSVGGAIALTFGVEKLLDLLGPSAEIRPLVSEYMTTRLIGTAGLCTAATLAAFFQGIGNTRTPLYMTLAANLVNVVLDYALIFGHFGLPAWGVGGAATATACAEWVYAAGMLIAFRRASVRGAHAARAPRPQLAAVRRLLRTGAPIGGQWMLEMLSFSVFLTMVARMGDAPLAASQIFISLLSMSFMQASGLGTGVATLVGRYIGAGEPALVQRSYRSALKVTAAFAGSVAVVFVALPGPLVLIFSRDAEVLALAGPLLAVGALFQLFDAFAIVTDGALRGAGDTRVPFAVRIVLAWAFFLPLAWLLSVHWEGGLTSAWIGGTAYVGLLAAYLVHRFRSGAWRHIQI
jgi:MATE family multidrug resistance protein